MKPARAGFIRGSLTSAEAVCGAAKAAEKEAEAAKKKAKQEAKAKTE